MAAAVSYSSFIYLILPRLPRSSSMIRGPVVSPALLCSASVFLTMTWIIYVALTLGDKCRPSHRVLRGGDVTVPMYH